MVRSSAQPHSLRHTTQQQRISTVQALHPVLEWYWAVFCRKITHTHAHTHNGRQHSPRRTLVTRPFLHSKYLQAHVVVALAG